MILTGAHYIYIIFILIILAVMIMKKDTIVPCMLGIFALAFFYTNNVVASVGAIWTGGGCLVPWSLIPAAAICGVSPMELAKRNFIPIIVGLIITTIVVIIII